MYVNKIFEKISTEIINQVEVQEIFNKTNTSVIDFCNDIAIYVAKRFMENIETYSECDIAMNNLYAFMLSNNEILNSSFPEPSLSIYYGFDEGEFYHSNDSESIDPVKKYTLPIICQIVKELDDNN